MNDNHGTQFDAQSTPTTDASLCANCQAKLSPIEAKMGRCLSCGLAAKNPSTETRPDDTAASSTEFQIRI